jgi:hypothetical protein
MNRLDFNRHQPRSQYQYSVYEHKLITSDSLVFSRSLIVVKNSYGVIIHFTRLHKYLESVSNKNKFTKSMTSDSKAKQHYVCSMLNYILIEKFSIFKANHIFQINITMLESFFSDYAITKKRNGKYKSTQSVEKCVFTILNFFQNLNHKFKGFLSLNVNELYGEKMIVTSHGKLVKKYIPKFKPRIMLCLSIQKFSKRSPKSLAVDSTNILEI